METIVFVHGIGSSARAWEPQLTALRDRYDVRATDLPGHGHREELFTLDRAVDDVCEEIGDGAHLVGISGGATIAMLVAMAAGDRVKSLLLSAPVAHTPPSFAIQRAVTAALPLSALVGMLTPMYSGGVAEYKSMAAEDVRLCGKDNLRRAFSRLAKTDLRPQLTQIVAPTLVVCGEKDRGNLASAQEVAEGIPDATLRSIPDAGHIWNLSQPKVFTDTVVELVDARK
ncbi:alpha/beta fold hydrolase [Stackebrandtia soli]|uniref:alpha/beta fold hydrolase n=1 Tax=Stackebrandtia soli TaxID=1892856 RepID=UPI0039EA2A11